MIEQPGMPSKKALVLGALGFVAGTVALTLVINAVGAEQLRAWIEQAGPAAPIAYLCIRALTFIVAPLSSGPAQFSAGVLFGLWEGLLLSILAEVIGGSVNFWIARRYGRGVMLRFVGREGMGQVEKFYAQAGRPVMLIYARLFLFAVYDFVCYAAGLTAISYRDFLLVTLIAGFVPTFISVYIGSSLTTATPQTLIAMYAALGVVCVVALLMYGRVRKWLGVG